MLAKIQKPETADYSVLEKDIEKQIILKLNEFNNVVQNALEGYKTHLLTGHLYELAKLFNSFYADCQVANAEVKIRDARYNLCLAVANSIKEGLSLIGIKAPMKM